MESLAGRVRKLIAEPESIRGNLPGIICAASLAHHKLLGSVERIYLWNVDLTSVLDEHLAALVSCAVDDVFIKFIRIGVCGMVTILDSVRSEWLRIYLHNRRNQSLGCEETRALVRAMESGVEEVALDLLEGHTLDIKELIEYNGLGKCRRIQIRCEHSAYSEPMRTWATSTNWAVAVGRRGSVDAWRN